ncbi:TetR/AcrR family transcriptional regulator [Agromyces atrinae]|uniref:TetR/AcrR family transcriptional regulator n=1 Tax=Agromyces atrinae TaxID=592376 RepID=UPI001F561B4F|nr:TetR/AcrR family transcriptional regulator [Agromyces atrinae]MCI2957714.1 TetR/AcrR family transcriptional regulator [Agromyces atrinae]
MSDEREPTRRRGRPTAADRERRRDQILDAAIALFVTNGFGHTSIDEIAATARVTKRTIYTFFGDKPGVFAAGVERFRERALAAVGADHETLHELAARIVFVVHSDDVVGLHRVMIGESRLFPELAHRFYESGPRSYIALLADRLSRDAPDSTPRAEALFGLLLGEPHRRRLLGLAPAPSRAEAHDYADSVLDLLGIASDA